MVTDMEYNITETDLNKFYNICENFISNTNDSLSVDDKTEFITNLLKEVSTERDNEDYNKKVYEFITLDSALLYDLLNEFKTNTITLNNLLEFKSSHQSYIGTTLKTKILDQITDTTKEALYDIVSKYFVYNNINNLAIYFKPKYTFSYLPEKDSYNYFNAISTYIDKINEFISEHDVLSFTNPNLSYIYTLLSEKNNTLLFRKDRLCNIHDEIIFIINFKYSTLTENETTTKNDVLNDIFENNMFMNDINTYDFYNRMKDEIINLYIDDLNNSLNDIDFNFNKYVNELPLPVVSSDINIENFKYILFKYFIMKKNNYDNIENTTLPISESVIYDFYIELNKLYKYILEQQNFLLSNLPNFYLTR